MAGRRLLAPLLLAAALVAQEPAFVRDESVDAPAGHTRGLRVADDVELRIVRGELFVLGPVGERVVASTAPTGAIRELTRTRTGTVFAACEKGLFVCDAQHLILDPADLRDGVPTGPVESVDADDDGRVWLCTADALWVVDPALRYGRVFGPSDGLPAPPFVSVVAHDDGRVMLWTRDGVFVYRRDVGEPPRLRAGPPPGEPLRASVDGGVALALDVEARGGAQLRMRRRHHHMVNPIVNGRIGGLRPGRHVLEVHAIDRDLRRTMIGEYTVDVPLPAAFDPRVLLGAAGVAAAMLWLLAFRAGRGERAGPRVLAATARAAIIGVVALQLVAATLGYGRSWPFVGFSMYTETWHENDVLFRPRITGLRADGVRVPLREQDVGVQQDGYWQMLAEVAFGGDGAARAFFDKVARCRADGAPPFTGFTLADGRIRLTAAGPVDVAPTVLVAWSER